MPARASGLQLPARHDKGARPRMITADDQIEYLPLFVYGTLLERSTRDSVLGPWFCAQSAQPREDDGKVRRTIPRLLSAIRSRNCRRA